jgi:ribosomal protein S18 acetylase RimI-like enzyme
MAEMWPDAFSWESQARQYAFRAEPGMHWERHSLGRLGDMTQIDCLLARDDDGLTIGILNYYLDSNNALEKKGNVNIWVRPDRQRQGLGTAMLREAQKRYNIDFDQQRYTQDGMAMIRRLVEKGILVPMK